MNNIFYVYEYLREDGSPYYVGKGKGNRMFSTHRKIPVPKNKDRIKLVKENLSEQEAFALEIKLIEFYGRKDLGTGILRNMTAGGDGLSDPGFETRKKMSDNVINGITGMKNKKHSPDTKKKMSEAKTGKSFSEEHLCALRLANSKRVGRKEDPELGKKRGEAISKAKKGRSNGRDNYKHSEESKIKIRNQKGWKHTDEAKQKMRGKKRTEEQIKNMSEARKGKSWSNQEEMHIY